MDMDNFFFGLQGVSEGAIEMVRQIMKYQLFWGFVIGFGVSTLVHGFLMSDDPRNVPAMVFQDKATSFQKIYSRDEGAPYKKSFHAYSQDVTKMKVTFALVGLMFLVMILLGLLSF